MAQLTAHQVQSDIYNLLQESTIADAINGTIYRQGYRPRDSRSEDITVAFTAGTTDEIQSGIVTLTAYVADITADGYPDRVEDGERTAEVEQLLTDFVEQLSAESNDYLFKLNAAVHTEADPTIAQHMVVAKIKYQYYSAK
jgi:hypothetical protein